MLELFEILAAIGQVWYLRRLLAFTTGCVFGFFAYAYFVGDPVTGDAAPDLLAAVGCFVAAVFFIYLTFRQRKETS